MLGVYFITNLPGRGYQSVRTSSLPRRSSGVFSVSSFATVSVRVSPGCKWKKLSSNPASGALSDRRSQTYGAKRLAVTVTTYLYAFGAADCHRQAGIGQTQIFRLGQEQVIIGRLSRRLQRRTGHRRKRPAPGPMPPSIQTTPRLTPRSPPPRPAPFLRAAFRRQTWRLSR